MALKQYKPNTPGQRGLVLVDKSDLYKGKPEKKLFLGAMAALNCLKRKNNKNKLS